jgi:hypothetical protein
MRFGSQKNTIAKQRDTDSEKGAAVMLSTRMAVRVIIVVGGGLLASFVVVSLITAASLVKSLYETRLISPQEFKGIGPSFQKRNTHVIIVHGIGHHCIGYADHLISNLFQELTARTPDLIKESYDKYADQIVFELRGRKRQTQFKDGAFTVSLVNPFRDGSCRVVDDIQYDVDPQLLNPDDDLESVTDAQDDLCWAINKVGKSLNQNLDPNRVAFSCHKLYVNREDILNDKENKEYVTGFIRRFSTNLTAANTLHIYEVTWSPATRWIKQPLIDLERFNTPNSEHWLNGRLKSDVINDGIADAVAYLSDSGVLVNFDILQAFCLTLANANSLYEEYRFACNQSHLLEQTGDFSEDNDVYLISHSLGTRVLFDSIGMLSLGSDGPSQAQETYPTLVATIIDKFHRIGAEVPEEYTSTSESEPTFVSALNTRIPEFAKAVRSIYVFTNQVPLLAANLSSPFQDTFDVGFGFQRFLNLRNPGNSKNARLQVVSFHDPDDVLSYNLGCWYYETVLKNFDETKELIYEEAKKRAMDELWNKDCTFKLRTGFGSNTEQEMIDNFRAEFKGEKKACGVLIVRAANDSENLTMARINEAGELLTAKIDDPSHELSQELNKQDLNEAKIIKLTVPDLLCEARGLENYKLRDTLFNKNCSDVKLNTKEDRQLYSDIWGVGENHLKLINAAVRLKGLRVFGFAAEPMEVHSNYFIDETVHGWIANGKGKQY